MFLLVSALFFAVLFMPQKCLAASAPSSANIMDQMTLEEKIGQMFLVCYDGSYDPAEEAADYYLGGYVFFADYFKGMNRKDVISGIKQIQKTAPLPLLTAVDEEGGSVIRISGNPALHEKPFSSPSQVMERGGFFAAKDDASKKADMLLDLGINTNLAPVCDVAQSNKDYIYERTIGEDPAKATAYAVSVVLASKEKNLGTCLKHFPGYGGSSDTHLGMATDNRPYKEFAKSDFMPFFFGIKAGADSVMVSHNIVNSMDPALPASLSKKVHDILRKDFGFDKVIITDDISMGAITDLAGKQDTTAEGDPAEKNEAAVMAVKAGNDLICTRDFREQIPAVTDAVKKGVISEKQINRSVKRIIDWKISLGLIK
ncbi:MAG TPA: glycoside hydrolase family 3 N-terminal domain-containing protein [Bacillota bacterium]|nr:glycoside hydrolase family 3 N-terminal domain-containing protein [Bacillota bacterium]